MITGFDLGGPLPTGKLAIEASAGTGKTFTLADLAARFLADGRATASELLLVTFTRAATDELRARVRNRVAEAVDHLASARPAPHDDVLLRLLSDRAGGQERTRLERALSEFDAATVTTIHGFAKQVLDALGVSAGTDPDARLNADSATLIRNTCADVLLAASTEECPLEWLPSLDRLVDATEVVDGRPDLDLLPGPEDNGAEPAHRLLRSLVDRCVRLTAERRRQRGTLSFDDVLTQLRDALLGPGGESAVGALRSRFRVVLVDEFQDTDPIQWEILSTLFDRDGDEGSLVLVGDPKQAIYGFRGADVHTYLRAVTEGGSTVRRSLLINWRSDDSVLRALEALFTGANFGGQDIPFVPVHAAEIGRGRYPVDVEGGRLPALSLRLAVGDGITRSNANDHVVIKGAAEKAIYADLALHVVRLLEEGRLPSSGSTGHRPVRPPDVAVLVATHAEAASVQSVLIDHGVPAVVARSGSVLQSTAAHHLRWLLEGLGRPADPRRVRMYALSWFGGRAASEVAALSEAAMEVMGEQLRAWSEMLASHSIADTFARIWADSGVVPRVLGAAEGDRHMTDLDHLVELFQGLSVAARGTVAGLLSILDSEPESEDDPEVEGDVSARRIASEAASVQIMTVWAAKGLEFPLVCVPTLWWQSNRDRPTVYVDPATGRRTFDLTHGADRPDGGGGSRRKQLAAEEETGERLRLLYVALTRARHQTVVWWANGQSSSQSALARVLFARLGAVIDGGLFAAPTVPIPSDQDVVRFFDPVVTASGRTIAVTAIDETPPVGDEQWARTSTAAGDGEELQVATLRRALDRRRQRWSFSAIVDRASEGRFDPTDPSMADAGAGDEGEDRGLEPVTTAHGPAVGDLPTAEEAHGGRSTNPLSDLPAGTAFGSLVHSVLERVDFASRQLDGELLAAIDEQLRWRPVDLNPAPAAGRTADAGRSLLANGLRAAIETPLGPRYGHARLADVGTVDRLAEVSFDFRLSEGGPPPGLRSIGRLVHGHLAPDDALAPWAARLADSALDLQLAGHLTGSIDLVVRLRDGAGGERYVVADYKTNILHPMGSRVTDEYDTDRLVQAMEAHDYPLQALLYSVALHRYLRWRKPGYQPEESLGGAAYLFLRGMAPGAAAERAAETGPPDGVPGVFTWDIPPSLVVALSDLLDGRGDGAP